MNIYHQAIRRASFGIASCLLLASGQTYSAELNLSTVPLFIDAGVDPNIMLVVDDSGSMGWEMLFSAEALAAHSRASDRDNLDFSPDNDEEARRLCPAYNVMAYNPGSTYTPWVGVDQYGNAFASIDDITEALDNPYCGLAGRAGDDCNDSSSNQDDVSRHVYMTWTDTDGDTKYDVGECPDLPTETTTTVTPTTIRAGRWHCQSTNHPGSTFYNGYGYCRNESYNWTINVTSTVTQFTAAACRADSNCVVVDDLTADQKENYGNWYTYYRKRDFVAKKATLALVDQASVRMGLGTLHDNNSVGRLITDMDDGNSSTTADATAKATLLQQIARIDPGSSTPTRQALYDAGEYYRTGNDNLFNGRYSSASSPILAEALGGQCQQNFTVVLTDGFTKGGYTTVGNTDSDGPGDFDGGVYADTLSNTLADVAMKYYEEDLSATLADFVPSSNGTSDLMHQHMVTYTVAFGVEGNLTCNPALSTCTENWPTSINYSSDDPNTIDDVWHAAVNGRGKYLAADDPQQLIDYLSATLDNIDARTSSSAAVAANSTTLNTGTVIYQAVFNTGDWHGNLRSLSVSIGSTDTRG